MVLYVWWTAWCPSWCDMFFFINYTQFAGSSNELSPSKMGSHPQVNSITGCFESSRKRITGVERSSSRGSDLLIFSLFWNIFPKYTQWDKYLVTTMSLQVGWGSKCSSHPVLAIVQFQMFPVSHLYRYLEKVEDGSLALGLTLPSERYPSTCDRWQKNPEKKQTLSSLIICLGHRKSWV